MLHLSLSAVHYLSLTLLTSLAFHRWLVVWRSLRLPVARLTRAPLPPAIDLPCVEVHLPLYNEPAVAARVVWATAALQWPPDRLRIRILDDSDDDTPTFVAAAIAKLSTKGPAILHERRASRAGFKAGALATALESADAEILVIFDADFLPPSDFLHQTVPALLADPSLAMVQARWSHLNANANALTSAQRVLLDGHFRLEQATRAHRSLPFNFNGTAGVWRASALRAAGGWQSDTLTEDLDVSYRAQLAGWRFAYMDALPVPAELPTTIDGLLGQQRRWAKGGTQTARKLWRSAMRSPTATWPTKWESTAHLWSNLSYVALATVMVTGPLLILNPQERWLPAWVDLLLFLAGGLGVIAYLARAAYHSCPRPLPSLAHGVRALMLDIGLTPQKARAVAEALVGHRSPFVRTPKHGHTCASVPFRASGRRSAGLVEIVLALAQLAAVLHVVRSPDATLVLTPILVVLAVGLGWVGTLRLLGSAAARRDRQATAVPTDTPRLPEGST